MLDRALASFIRFCAFAGQHLKVVVLVGGIRDGFFFAPYWTLLSEELDKIGW
jgi:hypothetical protein